MVCMTKEYNFLLKEAESASAYRTLKYTVLPLQIQVRPSVACIYIGRQKSELNVPLLLLFSDSHPTKFDKMSDFAISAHLSVPVFGTE